MNERLLVLDTATESMHVGLCDGLREWRRELPGGARASETLLPAIFALLGEAGLALASLGAIGFGRGPGAFTGVRTACAVTQGLAFGAGLPVLQLDSLMAVAEDARTAGSKERLWVAVDARMGEAYAARYERVQGQWRVLEAPALKSPAALARHIAAAADDDAVAGSSLVAHASDWSEFGGARWPDSAPRAGALLTLARSAWARGEALDAALALPLYVRDKVAQTSAERAAARVRE